MGDVFVRVKEWLATVEEGRETWPRSSGSHPNSSGWLGAGDCGVPGPL